MDTAPDPRGPSEGEELVGQTLAGRYAVTRVLGQGGMGVVVEARHLGMDRLVALKLLHASYSQNRHAVSRFEREMKVASRLEHPGCVRVYDVGQAGPEADNRLFLAMELLRGGTLGALIEGEAARGTRLTTGRIAALGAQIARALDAAHREGIVHRDLKPDNVMLLDTPEGEVVKVVDFGIARFFGDAEPGQLTAEGAVVGTPTYMSPEQAMGTEIGPASDLYSLGVVLFEMATGEVPFSAPTHVSLMVKHVQEPPPRPSTLAPVPPELEFLILACLEKDPRARPPSALEVARRLDALVAGRPGIGALAADTQRSRFAPSLHETDPSALAPGRPAERAASPPPPDALGPRDSAQATAPRRPIWPLAVGLGAIATAIALIAILGGTKPAPGTSAPGATPASDAPIAATSDAAAGAADPTAPSARARLDALLAARGAPLAPEPCRLGSARAITLAVATLEAADALARTPTETTRIRLEDALGAQRQLADDPTAQAAEGLLALAKGVSALAEVGVGEGGEGTEAAAALADKVIARCPAWAQPHHLRGRLAQRAGLNPAARKAYLAAIERDASWGAPRFNLALLDLDDGAPAAAEAGLSEVLRADEHWPDAHLVRAETRLRMGDAAGALSDALAAIAETPDRAEAWMVRGAAEQRAGVGDRGQAAYCRAKALGHAGAAALCPR